MNLTPNTFFSGSGNTSIGGATGSSAVSNGAPSAVRSLENHDWFSEKALGEGNSIDAASFDGSSEFTSVEHAAEQILSKLVSGGNGWG